MEQNISLSTYLKSRGVKSVADLARFESRHANTLFLWYQNSQSNEHLLKPLIARYLASKG